MGRVKKENQVISPHLGFSIYFRGMGAKFRSGEGINGWIIHQRVKVAIK